MTAPTSTGCCATSTPVHHAAARCSRASIQKPTAASDCRSTQTQTQQQALHHLSSFFFSQLWLPNLALSCCLGIPCCCFPPLLLCCIPLCLTCKFGHFSIPFACCLGTLHCNPVLLCSTAFFRRKPLAFAMDFKPLLLIACISHGGHPATTPAPPSLLSCSLTSWVFRLSSTTCLQNLLLTSNAV